MDSRSYEGISTPPVYFLALIQMLEQRLTSDSIGCVLVRDCIEHVERTNGHAIPMQRKFRLG
ncbi:hypothetical protein [Paraburkholderia dinghuensis]|uniref:hypothetical protein n=1 Tax=Paraburkholderia dinghuensis TaxID=2305225 RepID=UPI0016239171|nr:hypothetical protein [Paraburkholderia dinghuensis]